MLKLFPMKHQLSHRRHPLHLSSIRDVRSLLRIRFLNSMIYTFYHFLSSLLHKIGPKYRRECLPNETVLNLGKRKSEFLKLQQESRGLKILVMVSEHILVCLTLYISIICLEDVNSTVLASQPYSITDDNWTWCPYTQP